MPCPHGFRLRSASFADVHIAKISVGKPSALPCFSGVDRANPSINGYLLLTGCSNLSAHYYFQVRELLWLLFWKSLTPKGMLSHLTREFMGLI